MRWKITVRVEGEAVQCRVYVSRQPHNDPEPTWDYRGIFILNRGAEFISLMKQAPGMSYFSEGENGNLFDATGDYAEELEKLENDEHNPVGRSAHQ